jgi:hypothetical protein
MFGTVACSAVEPISTPSLAPSSTLGNVFAIPWSQEHFGSITVFVDDQSGLVLDATKVLQAGEIVGAADVAAVVEPQHSSLLVAWIGGICRFGPTVTIREDSDRLAIAIRPEAGGRLPPGIACNDLGVFYGVRLNLSMRVEQDAVSVELNR